MAEQEPITTLIHAQQQLEYAGINPPIIRSIYLVQQSRQDRIMALIELFGALRQSDICRLLDASRATISRDVTELRDGGVLQEYPVQEGATGRPVHWYCQPACDLPQDEQRQEIQLLVQDLTLVLREKGVLQRAQQEQNNSEVSETDAFAINRTDLNPDAIVTPHGSAEQAQEMLFPATSPEEDIPLTATAQMDIIPSGVKPRPFLPPYVIFTKFWTCLSHVVSVIHSQLRQRYIEAQFRRVGIIPIRHKPAKAVSRTSIFIIVLVVIVLSLTVVTFFQRLNPFDAHTGIMP